VENKRCHDAFLQTLEELASKTEYCENIENQNTPFKDTAPNAHL